MEYNKEKHLQILEDVEWLKLNGWYINCHAEENAEYLIGLEEKVQYLQEENNILKRRLNDMISLTAVYGNH